MTIQFKDINRSDIETHTNVTDFETEASGNNFIRISFKERFGQIKIRFSYFVEWVVIKDE